MEWPQQHDEETLLVPQGSGAETVSPADESLAQGLTHGFLGHGRCPDVGTGEARVFVIQRRAALTVCTLGAVLVLALQSRGSIPATSGTSFLSWALTTLDEESGFCNSSIAIPGPVHPRKLNVTGDWANRCLTEAHFGHWTPPKDWPDGERNWCWVEMKDQSTNHMRGATPADLDLHGRPLNWWWAQVYASRAGMAPPPEQQRLLPLLNPELCDVKKNGLSDGVSDDAAYTAAHDWVVENVQVFVLNLPQNVERMRMMRRRLESLQIPFERVDGLDLTKPGALDWAKDGGYIPESWDHDKAEEKNRWQWTQSPTGHKGSQLLEIGLGTAGCTAAHLNAMSTAAKAGKPLALILEDDTWLNDDFIPKLYNLLHREAPCDWEVINLAIFMTYGECVTPHLARIHPDGNEPEEICRKVSNWSFGAMLYKVADLERLRGELESIVWDNDRPSCLIHDMAFASLANRIRYYGVPAVQYPGFVSFVKTASIDRETLNR